MTFALTDEQEQIQTVLRDLLLERAQPRACFDGGPSLDGDLWSALVELGFAGLGLGDAAGGMDAGLIDQVIAAEEIGRAVAAVPFLTSTVVSGSLLTQLGDGAANELAGSLVTGQRILATALPETRSTSYPVTAESHGAEWRLRGEIPLVLGGEIADVLLVPAIADGDLALFAVESSSPAATLTELPTLDPTRRAASVVLDDVITSRIGADADIPGMLGLARMRAQVILAAEALGAASRALELATEHAKSRVQFGRPIGQFQAIKHTLADMLVDVENARSATYNAAWTFDELGADAYLDVAMAKGLATENAVSTVNRAIQIHGGMGVTWEDDLHLLLRRTKSCELFMGDPGFHLETIAAHLLDGAADAIEAQV